MDQNVSNKNAEDHQTNQNDANQSTESNDHYRPPNEEQLPTLQHNGE